MYQLVSSSACMRLGRRRLARLVTCLFPPDLPSEVDSGGWGVATGISTPRGHVTSASQRSWGHSSSGCVVFQGGKEDRCIEVESRKRSQMPSELCTGATRRCRGGRNAAPAGTLLSPTVWVVGSRMGLGRPRAVAASERKHSAAHCNREKQELSPRESCEL